MNLYTPYFDTIRKAMSHGVVNESTSSFDGVLNKSLMFSALRAEVPENKLLPGLQELAEQLGTVPNFNQTPGLHPDFAHLKESDDTENHYITSMFIDIKGSTNLFKKYDPLTVMIITNTIQKAAIHTCLVFGGYIHRLQGDGLFVYFGGKNITKKVAIERALQSAAMVSYFVKNDLKELFEEQGIERIYTRIGIDLGYDDDVIWAKAGIGEISEITTCSLHTSLAAKMQAFANNNGIVIGDYIKNEVLSLNQYFTPSCQRLGDENTRYIFQIPEKNIRYTQHDFNWFPYLKSLSFIATDQNEKLSLRTQNNLVYSNRNIQNIQPVAEKNKPYFNF
jgi:adenylate cyclase